MFDPRNNLANEVSAQLVAHFADKVFRTVIPRNIRLAEAPSFGKPALFHDRESRGALAYLALAGEMIRREEGQNGIVRATPEAEASAPAASPATSASAPPAPVTPAAAPAAPRAQDAEQAPAGNGSSGNGAAAAGNGTAAEGSGAPAHVHEDTSR
jgi:chromosome partitioning protein